MYGLTTVSEKGYTSPVPAILGEDIIVLSTTVHSGNMSFNNGDLEKAQQNREQLFKKLKLDINRLVVINPSHQDKIVLVSNNNLNLNEPVRVQSDALITLESKLILGLATADCIPVFFYEPTKKIISLAHAGRQGVELSILTKILEKITENGGDITKVKIYLGPNIQRCCYHFPAEPFAKEFEEKGWDKFSSKLRSDNGEITFYNIDIRARAISQLLNFMDNSGEKISPMNISLSLSCTYCSGLFFSHRRSQLESKPEHRFLSLIVKTS